MADQETLDAIAVMLDGLETRLYQKLDEKLEEKLELKFFTNKNIMLYK